MSALSSVTAGHDLMTAFIIGIAFGWTLERAGLANARKLAGQFTLTDSTVLKVMFSAITTAMIGLFWLGWFGLVDVGGIEVPETFVAPQIIGGLLFGAGFALSGLCPGTSCVSAATGRIDGLVTMLGMLGGALLTGLALPAFEHFYSSTPRGVWTLPEALHLTPGLIVLATVSLALVCFRLVERFEARA